MYVMHKFGKFSFIICSNNARCLPPEQEPTEWSVLVWILYDSGGSKIAYSKKQFLPIIEQQEVV